MRDANSSDLLRRLCLAAGPPGAEDEVRRIVRRELTGLGELSHDRLGSVLCEKTGQSDGPRVMLDSHLDEVAFLVQSVSAEGRLGFVTLGSWWPHVLLGQRVDIVTERGLVPGVFGATPPHFLSAADREKVLDVERMFIDVGASSAGDVTDLGVRLGDPVVPHAEFVELGVPGVLSCKALDNRLGVALMCETLRALDGKAHPNVAIGVAAAQEELGARGGGTTAALARPDVAIVLECTPADDLPGFEQRQAVMGGGPQVRFFDPTAVANRALVRLVEQVAQEIDVPVQLAVRRSGGTDAKTIHLTGSGVPTVVIGVPARYIHTHVGLMQWRDYVAARDLLVALVGRLDREQVAGLVRFD